MWRLLDLGAVDCCTMTNLYVAVGRAVAGAYERLGLMVFGAEQGDFVETLLKARVEP